MPKVLHHAHLRPCINRIHARLLRPQFVPFCDPGGAVLHNADHAAEVVRRVISKVVEVAVVQIGAVLTTTFLELLLCED